MKATECTFTYRQNLGNYSHREVTLTIVSEPDEKLNGSELIEKAKEEIKKSLEKKGDK